MGSVQPCISCFVGARNLGRALATLPAFAEYLSPLGLLVHWLVILDAGTVAGFAKQLDIPYIPYVEYMEYVEYVEYMEYLG